MRKARSMRIAAQCPVSLWDEFYLTVTHLHSKTKTSAMDNITPDELWHGRKPDYSYIYEIGCQVFVLILHKHNPKVFVQSIECVLVGYDENSKAYQCYERSTKKVYSSYHVKFIESHNEQLSAPTITAPSVLAESEIPTIDLIKSQSSPLLTPAPVDDKEPPNIPGHASQYRNHDIEQEPKTADTPQDSEPIIPSQIPKPPQPR